ncbi:Cytochrome c oxidase caa3 assembly factor (Caa3_CtaG) [Halobacillus karajensis]|uniref:Cytochrome c oxidase caa3 assembly factor (Caa3_CtaG) n=1 Tax=Halobacillus karajensis TaxID=195088 RepID=A0A024P9R0_9BACI|nr:cytochrome c oxidase assembly protein [Halobacillus karajensis]CDQ20187.1 Cytochrome c oxidase caa3 assembly factor (Caa3_CtaG) [Halobacillus karajensis]CDQ25152.1 Cytochrome c oxidase caa3 assembly factor (Caa3_CtaG) [Halobacillus karajensis]CDQ28487.1 Cytochrome c oxidase caa3 assembly factor (Caa3_CtaG) [Halobacillus karajensis]
MVADHQIEHNSRLLIDIALAVPFVTAVVLYIGAAIVSSHYPHLRKWPLHRTIFWILGIFLAAISVIGPLAEQAHKDFTAHMTSHLLLGMTAPLLLVLAAPMTLLLRTLQTTSARRVSRYLKSRWVRFFSHPIVASILNIGGLWILYTTDVYTAMHQSVLIYIVGHVHIFLAGYLFTMSMIYVDPIAHRFGYAYRSIILVIALAGHGILAKSIYAAPPPGVPAEKAEAGGMLMYYGGDAVDLIIIFLLCLHWYRATAPRKMTLATE